MLQHLRGYKDIMINVEIFMLLLIVCMKYKLRQQKVFYDE